MERGHRGLAAAVFLALAAWRWHPVGRHALAPGAFDAASSARALAWAGADLLLAAGLALGLKAAGRAVLGAVLRGARRPSWLEAAELPAGFGAAGTLLLALGSAGLYRPPVLAGLCAVLAAAGAVEARRLKAAAPPGGAAAGVAAFLAAAVLLKALAPPVDLDALKYHLALPELYLAAGRVVDLPWNFFSRQPHAHALAYGLPLSLGRDSVPALLHAALASSLLLTTYRAAREELSGEAAGWAAALLALQPVLLHQAGGALSDAALASLHLPAALCLLRWRGGGGAAWAGAGGLFAGLGAAVKLHGLLLAALWGAWLLARAARRREGRAAASFLGWAALAGAPWYLKAWAASGSPVWPWGAPLFSPGDGADILTAAARGWPDAAGLRFILLGDGAVFLLLPALAAASAALLGGRRLPAALFFLLAPLPFYALAAAGSVSAWRYCLPFFPALALTFGWGAAALSSSRAGRAARSALLAAVLPAALGAADARSPFAVLGLRSLRWPEAPPRLAYLRAALPFQAMRERIAREVGPGGRVALVGDDAVFGLGVPYLFTDPYLQGLARWMDYPGPTQAARALRALGATHLCVNRSEDWQAEALRRVEPALPERAAETGRLGSLLAEAGGRELYRLP